MAIIQNVNFSLFCDAFVKAGRESSFSYEGKRALFDYLESVSEDCEQNIELDVVALCCEYSEDDTDTIVEQYDIDLSDCEGEDDKEKAIEAFLNNSSVVVGKTSCGFVYAVF